MLRPLHAYELRIASEYKVNQTPIYCDSTNHSRHLHELRVAARLQRSPRDTTREEQS